ncbi:hypothetical protein T11_15946 [Trichinella zimbabwensis]|uniref:Secreted protein n=1 Tax=Trichinella zimbabwensis TaxID=268475 RepID=A0A0V1HSR8_9BILA|nr:hypothetical protein T11_15946 [Trichinella zimbabwensis]
MQQFLLFVFFFSSGNGNAGISAGKSSPELECGLAAACCWAPLVDTLGVMRVRQILKSQDRQEDDAVHNADQDDQEHSFEERLHHVRVDVGEHEHAEYGRQTALDDWPGKTAEGEANSIQRGVVLADRVRVGDVRGKVDRKADRHDQRDHRHAIHGQVPQCHVADDADVDRSDHQRHPD